MKTYKPCIPCFFRQAANASQLLGISCEHVQEMQESLQRCIDDHKMDEQSPPEMAVSMQKLFVKYSQNTDPYASIKAESNRMALEVLDDLRSLVSESTDQLKKAVELACAGNIIDYGVSSLGLDVRKEIESILQKEEQTISDERFQLTAFEEALKQAQTVLYVGDNAGEIVFDRVLLETIKHLYPHLSLSFATRGTPILNDVLLEDAHVCGIEEVATVISSGVSTPGLVLSQASKEFLALYPTYDLIISKGQGNYEALSDSKGPIFFLFIAKCGVITGHVGCRMHELILLRNKQYK